MLPGKGVAQLDAASFFEVDGVEPGAYVSANSDVSVAGFEFVASPDGDLEGLNAREFSEQLTHLFFPQMVVLGPFQTELGLVNYSASPVIMTVSAFQADGTLYGTENLQNNPVTLSLNPRQSRLENLETLFGFMGEETLGGWLQVESTSSSINGYLSYGIPSTGALAAVTSAAQGSTRAVFSHIATIQGLFTGVAVLNTGQLAANIRILAIRPDGEVLGFFGTVLQPGNRLSELIDNLIPAAAGQGGGFIWFKSDLPVQMTSLFGSAKVLSNVPPQPSPSSFQPDSGITPLLVKPPFAIVQPQSKQEFQALGATDSVSWSVNGFEGGNATIGTIDSQGVFTAPGQVPDPRVLTISAQSPSQVGGASVDVPEKSVLFTSLSVIQSVAYLGSLERLYTAELAILSGGFSTGDGLLPTAARGQTATNSDIFEFAPDGSNLLLSSFENEEIVNMKPFRAFNGAEFLLLVARTSGKIIRFNPSTQLAKDVIVGLNQPTTAVIDSTGNLLIAEADKVSIFPRTLLEADLSAAALTKSGGRAPLRQEVFGTSNISGMAVDACSGDIYVSDPDNGQILRLVRLTGQLQIQVTGVDDPGPLLTIYRSRVTCPESFQLLALERGQDRILLIIPATGEVTPWFAANQATDLTLIPDGTPFVATSAVLLAELLAADTQQNGFLGGVSTIEISGVIDDQPVNPPQDQCQAITLPPALEAAVKEALGLVDTDSISCDEVENLTALNAPNQGITSLGGLEVFVNLTTISLDGNSISNIGDYILRSTRTVSGKAAIPIISLSFLVSLYVTA